MDFGSRPAASACRRRSLIFCVMSIFRYPSGSHPFENSITLLKVVAPSPPIKIGGCGFCTGFGRSEEHTSELQSLAYLVCRLLLEKKKAVSMLYLPTLGIT